MTIKELLVKGDAELLKDLAALREKQRELRFKVSSQETKNSHEARQVRKDAARILTVIRQRAGESK